MISVSRRTLKILAAIAWYIGGIVLLLKGASLLLEAEQLRPSGFWPWPATAIGLLLGGLKAKFIFIRSCRRNLDRIAALQQPKIWQFFRPVFFAALAVMILAGAVLSRLAHNGYPWLIGVATLDLALATALFGSSYIFWKRRMVEK
jgi:hypothetical protein